MERENRGEGEPGFSDPQSSGLPAAPVPSPGRFATAAPSCQCTPSGCRVRERGALPGPPRLLPAVSTVIFVSVC